jgi:hypothetical protein
MQSGTKSAWVSEFEGGRERGNEGTLCVEESARERECCWNGRRRIGSFDGLSKGRSDKRNQFFSPPGSKNSFPEKFPFLSFLLQSIVKALYSIL